MDLEARNWSPTRNLRTWKFPTSCPALLWTIWRKGKSRVLLDMMSRRLKPAGILVLGLEGRLCLSIRRIFMGWVYLQGPRDMAGFLGVNLRLLLLPMHLLLLLPMQLPLPLLLLHMLVDTIMLDMWRLFLDINTKGLRKKRDQEGFRLLTIKAQGM